jgi:hypothetical protein
MLYQQLGGHEMTDKISITAGGIETVAEGENLIVAVTAETVVTLTAKPPNNVTLTSHQWSKDGTALSGKTDVTLTITAGETAYGAYTVSGKDSAQTAYESITATVKEKPVAKTAETEPQGVAEVEIGEYDREFTWLSFGVIIALTVGGLFFAFKDLNLRLPGKSDTVTTGTFAERLRTLAVVVALSLGIVATGFGIWLAGLEVRGRLRARAKLSGPAGLTENDKRGAIDKASDIITAASKARGTIAVMLAAVAFIVGALWAVGHP